MKVTVLGTAAAEGWPALWCVCEACREAARRGGRNLRLRTAYNIDHRIQIDLGPDALIQMWQHNVNYARMEHLLFTHSHGDHCMPENVGFRRYGFAVLPENSLLHVYGNEEVKQLFELARVSLPLCQAEFHLIRPFETLHLGEVRAIPLRADHAGAEEAVIYLLEGPTGSLLQAHDTGWYPDETWDFLAGREVNAVLLDCTYGLHSGGASHLGAPQVVEMVAELKSVGALTPNARAIATHFSHNGGALYDELVEFFAPHGIEVAYDGMIVEV
ncbi:MAG: MBL fold metallo-hydrolase [Candidatus Zipacnadales bacterium]